jgi:hypothetical protein
MARSSNVVEADLGRGTEPEAGAGAELTDRLGHDVGERVAPTVERILLVTGGSGVVRESVVDFALHLFRRHGTQTFLERENGLGPGPGTR